MPLKCSDICLYPNFTNLNKLNCDRFVRVINYSTAQNSRKKYKVNINLEVKWMSETGLMFDNSHSMNSIYSV